MERQFIIANSIKEAVLAKNDSFVFSAGGTDINRLGSNYADKSIISLKKLNLNTISKESDYLKIGSCTTFQSIVDSRSVPSYFKKSCLYMASRTKRNMATIGGNIALKRTDSYLIPVLVASNAKLIMQNYDLSIKEISVIDYIKSNNYSNSLILYVLLPLSEHYISSARCSNTALSHAFITLAISFDGKDFKLFAGLKNSGFSDLKLLSDNMKRKKLFTIDEIESIVNEINDVRFYDDIYGSVEYKKYILCEKIYELYSEAKGVNI